jgi:hypothetical protein
VDAATIERSKWERRQSAHRDAVRPRVDDWLNRASRREKHPVHDFLFEYYSFRPSHLMRWSPGFGVHLEGATRDEIGWTEFRETDGGLILDAGTFPKQRLGYLDWAIPHLEATLGREPNFACFGLHEWAMIYRDPAVRHPYVPLRLPRAEIDAFVESQSLRCSHYDAFRFFTADAAPRNRVALTRAVATEHEQPGCIHANMDLYKFAYKIAPFGTSELLVEAFRLAEAARAVDMRASPYDLTGYGYVEIPIETREGREEYVLEQRRFAERAAPIRAKMLTEYERLRFHLAPGSAGERSPC